jgi:(p)ppGpp synthase/HD superfamily hydrolase
MHLTEHYSRAVDLARSLHDGQTRKGTEVPYLSHLLAVSAIVLEQGGTEDQAIAALLHDAVEDQGGAATLERIRVAFGEEVARIVDGCSDTDRTPKPPWRERKEGYLRRLRSADAGVRLVSLSDKVHNARSLLLDYRRQGEALWSRFHVGREEQLWYQRSLVEVFRQGPPAAPVLLDEFAAVVDALVALAPHD